MSYYAKVGECVTVPLKLQVVKIYAREDHVFYLAIPVDQPKRLVVLKDPYFMVCTEYDSDSKLPDMHMEMLEQAAKWVEDNLTEDQADETEEETGDEDGGQ